jgi:hypothetical protein
MRLYNEQPAVLLYRDNSYTTLAITGALGSAREANSLGRAYAVFGSMILIIGAMAAIATFLANKGSFDERGNKVR